MPSTCKAAFFLHTSIAGTSIISFFLQLLPPSHYQHSFSSTTGTSIASFSLQLLPHSHYQHSFSSSTVPASLLSLHQDCPLAPVPALLLSLHQDSFLSFLPPTCILLTSSPVPACLFPSTATPSYPLSTLRLSCYQHSFSSTTGSSMPFFFPSTATHFMVLVWWTPDKKDPKKMLSFIFAFFFFLFVLKFRLNTSFVATVIRPHLSGLGCCLLKGIFWVANRAAVKTVMMKTEW